MRAIVIGSAAGGGFPQWNCACPNCVRLRQGQPGLVARAQDSVAVTSDGERFALINASPDVLAQIKATPALWPRAPRHSPIGAVVLTNGDLDHVLGLFSMRERQPFAIYATEAVWAGLVRNVIVRTLRRFEGQVVWRPLQLGREIDLADAAGDALQIRARAFAAAGKLPVHLAGDATPTPEDNIGVSLRDARSDELGLAYAAACASVDGLELDGHRAVLFDGTFYREDELVRLGLSRALAADMAHLPIAGDGGSLARLRSLAGRKIYTHVNNNPILAPSQERREVEEAGWEIAYDGMEIIL